MDRRNHTVKILRLITLLFVPLTALACFQVGQAPTTLHDKDIKVRFLFDGKPIANAPVSLWSHQKGTITRGSTDSYGWCVLKEIPPGEYQVRLNGPSPESVNVVLTRSETGKSAMLVSFVGDWCQQVSVIQDKS